MSEMVKVTVEVRKDHYNTLKYGVKHWPENYDENEKAIANGTEVKQGHWIWVVDESPATPVSSYELNWAGWACDHCRKQPDDDSDWDDWNNPPKYKYCPNCGAEMGDKTDGI